MFGGAKSWADRKVAAKPCRNCHEIFQPKAGGSLYCSDCGLVARRANHSRAQRQYVKKNPKKWAEYRADFNLRRSFGITLQGYRLMLKKQKNGCATCGTKKPKGRGVTRKFDVDHCHKSGKVRGLLCTCCNRALGLVNDNLRTLKSMIRYLEIHHGA